MNQSLVLVARFLLRLAITTTNDKNPAAKTMQGLNIFPGLRSAWLLLLMLCATSAGAGQRILGIDVEPERAVIHIEGPVQFRHFDLSGPARIVVDVQGARMDEDLLRARAEVGQVLRVRSAARNGSDQRIVFDLRRRLPARVHGEADPAGGYRIVVDFGTQPVAVAARRGQQCDTGHADFVVVLDAGHGGHDQGAVGPSGWQEKDVALAITQRLQRLIQKTPYMHGVMTRDDDQYISLQQRYRLAERCRADLLVSIHADSLPGTDIRGASVYVHSRARRKSRALLATRAGRILPSAMGSVRDAVLNLSDRRGAAHALASFAAGSLAFRELAAVTPMVRRSVLPGRFVVLSSEVPSILVETGYISHEREEAQLIDPKHQQVIADALYRAIQSYAEYFGHGPGLTDRRVHIVGSRTDLLGLAQRFQWDLDTVRRVNHLPGTDLVAGTVLQVPSEDRGG